MAVYVNKNGRKSSADPFILYKTHSGVIMGETKRTSCQYITSAIFALLLVSCSTSNIIGRGEFIERNSIKKETPRADILLRFGTPVDTEEKDEGNKIDLFRVEQGSKKSAKVLKGTSTFLLAIGTYGLSEFIVSPKTKHTDAVIFEVSYDKDERVDKVKYVQLPK